MVKTTVNPRLGQVTIIAVVKSSSWTEVLQDNGSQNKDAGRTEYEKNDSGSLSVLGINCEG